MLLFSIYPHYISAPFALSLSTVNYYLTVPLLMQNRTHVDLVQKQDVWNLSYVLDTLTMCPHNPSQISKLLLAYPKSLSEYSSARKAYLANDNCVDLLLLIYCNMFRIFKLQNNQILYHWIFIVLFSKQLFWLIQLRPSDS